MDRIKSISKEIGPRALENRLSNAQFGLVYKNKCKLADAIIMSEQASKIGLDYRSEGDSGTIFLLEMLGRAYANNGQHQKAEKTRRQALRGTEKRYGA